MANLDILEPQYGFWQVTVAVETEVEGPKGDPKIKTVKEVHLVDGVSATDVEKKVAQAMEGTMSEWKIVSMAVAKTQYVY